MNFKNFVLKLTSFLLIAVMLCCSLPMASIAHRDDDDDDDRFDREEDVEYMTKEEAAEKVKKSELFTALYNGIRNCEEIIDLSALNCTEEDLDAIWDELSYSAGLFHHDAWYDQYNFQKGTDYLWLYAPGYYWEPEECKEKIKEYDSLMAKLYALGSKSWSDLEIVLFYHDYLAANYAYDTSYKIYDAYGFLTEKKGLCQSYTMVFNELMDHYGIPCTYAQSNTLRHTWNVVYLDGYWYHLDVTYDDPLRKGADIPGSVSKKYFLLGSEENEELRFDRSRDNDIVYGCNITPAEDDHPSSELWCSDVRTPAVYYDGSFYSIVTAPRERKAYLCKLDLEEYTYDALTRLPFGWDALEGSIYSESFSNLCTDGDLIYYNSTIAVCSYDPQTGEQETLETCDMKRERVYGLRMEGHVLKAYTAKSANVQLKNSFEVALPLITGDVDHDNTLTISDVTQTLNLLANDGALAAQPLADVDNDGLLTISDITALLNTLAGKNE